MGDGKTTEFVCQLLLNNKVKKITIVYPSKITATNIFNAINSHVKKMKYNITVGKKIGGDKLIGAI